MIHEILDCCKYGNEIPKEILSISFGEILWCWIGAARKRLKEKAGEKLSLLSNEALLSMEISLLKRWSTLCTPSMLCELQIAKISFLLKGNSSRERYLDFIQNTFLKKENLTAFFAEYSELARLVTVFQVFWENQAIEFLTRLERDLPLLEDIFTQGKSFGIVAQLKLDAGDVHQEGRSVFLLKFESGRELFYKPKNLDIVKNFNSYVARLTELGLKLPLKTYNVLPRGEYGWEEKVEQKPCLSDKEVNNYFQRAGMYLCLLYLLDGTDVHYENIIASGEHPVFIDLETIFHAQLRNDSHEITEQMVGHSVLSIGLLPCYVFTKTKHKGRDISGLGLEEVGMSQQKWEQINTDEMKSIIEPVLRNYTNQVLFNNVIMRAKDYVDPIVSGFNEMYVFIKEKREILQKEGWYELMANNPVRILLRPTRFYAYIRQNLYEPKGLSDEIARGERLSLLSRSYGKDSKRPESIAVEEIRSLLQGDIPCFHSVPSSTDLYSGHTLIASDCLEKPAITSVIKRIANMGDPDRTLQETFIRHAFYAKIATVHEIRKDVKCEESQLKGMPNDEDLLSLVEDLASELKNSSFQSSDGSLGWISLEPNLETEQFQLTPITESLYSGRAGIALFFAALSRFSQKMKWREIALNSLKSIRADIHQGKANRLINRLGIGGMAGIGGIIYSLFHIGKLINENSLIEDAKRLAYDIQEKHIQENINCDVVLGNAGLILTLLSFYKSYPDPHYLKIAEQAGSYLCDKAKNLIEKTTDKLPLGLSHGAAGMAFALLNLASVTKKAQFYQKAQDFISYERFFYSPQNKNWPQLETDGETYRCAWCHGATGIGLARLGSIPLLHDQGFTKEINDALMTTKAHINKVPINLCCGSLGHLEFLRSVAKAQSSKLEQNLPMLIESIFHQIKQNSDIKDFYNPGFMQGHAGIGYTFLRLLDKVELLPQVLLLQ